MYFVHKFLSLSGKICVIDNEMNTRHNVVSTITQRIYRSLKILFKRLLLEMTRPHSEMG